MIVDRAVYRNGVRDPDLSAFDDLFAACRSGEAMAWLGLYEPTHEELTSVARAFDLHELAVEDAVKAHQRPKLERYGDVQFIVLRPAVYVDETETVVFGEVEIFLGPNFVITVRHGDAPDLGAVRRALEARPELLARGPVAIVYGIADHVVDGYQPVVSGLENDIDEIEDEVFGGSANASRRTYELTREVIEFQRATKPLAGILARLIELPGVDLELSFDELGRHVSGARTGGPRGISADPLAVSSGRFLLARETCRNRRCGSACAVRAATPRCGQRPNQRCSRRLPTWT